MHTATNTATTIATAQAKGIKMKLTVCVEKGVEETKGAMPILLLILLQLLLLRDLRLLR